MTEYRPGRLVGIVFAWIAVAGAWGLGIRDAQNPALPATESAVHGSDAPAERGLPDICEPVIPPVPDCNGNGIVDLCEDDCNSNGVPDECDLTEGTSADCNGNGIPDECDIGGSQSGDCNGNMIPDECDIENCPPDTPACDDCNLNGAPDECDIAGGTSQDVDSNGIPDECRQWAGGTDNNWSTADNWEGGEVPNNVGEQEFSPSVIGASSFVIMDIPVTINTLRMLDGARLDITQGDLTLATSNGMLINQATLFLGDGRAVGTTGASTAVRVRHFGALDVAGASSFIVTGPMTLISGGTYRPDPDRVTPTSSFLEVGSVLMLTNAAGGEFFLEDTMVALVHGDFLMNGIGAVCPLRGGSSPPRMGAGSSGRLSTRGGVSGGALNISNDWILLGDVIVELRNGVIVVVGGNFDNRSTSPECIDLSGGNIILTGGGARGGAAQFELAGTDVGAQLGGFVGNFSLGELGVAAGAVVEFADGFANANGAGSGPEALYVGTLHLAAGSTIRLFDGNIYYQRLIDEGANIEILGNGSLAGVASPARMDVKPGSCPNSFNPASHGVVPVALVSTSDFDAEFVDPSTVRLSRADGMGSVAPNEGPPGPHSVVDDVAAPFDGPACECSSTMPDGIMDLSMHFRTNDVVAELALDEFEPGSEVELVATGTLLDGTPFVASDCIRVVPPAGDGGTLTVRSNLAEAWIDVDPLDAQHDGGGFSEFVRTYPLSTSVHLTGEEFYLGQRLVGWKLDGVFSSPAVSTTVEIANPSQTVDAVFRRTGDITGDTTIDLNDFAVFAVCFGSSWGSPSPGCSAESQASADLDRSGTVDLADFATFATSFGL